MESVPKLSRVNGDSGKKDVVEDAPPSLRNVSYNERSMMASKWYESPISVLTANLSVKKTLSKPRMPPLSMKK